MAMRKQLSLSNLLHLRHHTSRILASSSIPSLSDPSSSSIESQHFTNTSTRYLSTLGFYRHSQFTKPHNFLLLSNYRSFSTNESKPTDAEQLSDPGFFDYDYGGGGGGEVIGAIGSGNEAILPIRCLIWFLDTVHDLTGMPWWMVIVISTLALRVVILPVLLVQLRLLKKNAELAPK